MCHTKNNQLPTNETILKYYIKEDKPELTKKKVACFGINHNQSGLTCDNECSFLLIRIFAIYKKSRNTNYQIR